ncbi:unnamed protein product [Closterium sp. Yama58-4]|nr:unnamed protein product [Closterium sp. Yama58-4]
MVSTSGRVLILAFFAALVALAYSDDNKDYERFNSLLIGSNEVPKNNTEAARNAVGDKRGMVHLKLKIYKEDGKPAWLEYSVKALKLEGEMPPTKTHIHPGNKGQNNPVLLDLPCSYERRSRTDWRCKGSLGKNEHERTNDLVSALKDISKNPKGHYGNIHTKNLNVTIYEAFLAAALVANAYAAGSRRDAPFSTDAIEATLLGKLEVPKHGSKAARNAVGDPSGFVKMRLDIHMENGQPAWLEYRLAAFHMQGKMPPTMTHVHKATAGLNGPKVLDLPCEYQFEKDNGIWLCSGVLGKVMAERTTKLVSTFKAIRKNPRGFYGNIHTLRYPDGAARGQLSKAAEEGVRFDLWWETLG